MHPFHRLSRYVPSHNSCSNQRKERQGVGCKDRDEYEDDCHKSRKTSPCRTRSYRDEKEHEGYPEVPLPIISVSPVETELRPPSRINILKAKEMVLWSSTSPDWSDDTERLGPNKNSIIEETLRSNK